MRMTHNVLFSYIRLIKLYSVFIYITEITKKIPDSNTSVLHFSTGGTYQLVEHGVSMSSSKGPKLETSYIRPNCH